MPEVMMDRPDVHVFWSAYDPLDLASDSIDPLGFMAGYVALADRILPGFTTLTTVPRYAGMFCHALKATRDSIGDGQGHSIAARRQLIIEKLKLFERAWGLACGLAEEDSSIGTKATNGLRGIRSIHRWLGLNARKERLSLTFALTANQVRNAGIGAYGTFLESLHLADMSSLTLRPLGEQLADAFPTPGGYNLDVLRDGGRSLSTEGMRDWGRQAHAGALSLPEAQVLRRALQGGEEAELDDHARWAMLRLLGTCVSQSETDERRVLASCLSSLKKPDQSGSSLVGRANARLVAALQLIETYERLYQCAMFVFDQIRFGASASGHVPLKALMDEQALVDSCAQMRKAAAGFLSQLQATSANEDPLGVVKQSLKSRGFIELAQVLAGIEKPLNVGQELLRRHQRVQEGKFDGGLPKGPWVRLEPGALSVARLTTQRFGLKSSDIERSWQRMQRHPYRTFGAMRFVKLCRIQ
jgi:hypothetical protein